MLVRDLADTGYIPAIFVMLGLADLAGFHTARISTRDRFQAVGAAMLDDCAEMNQLSGFAARTSGGGRFSLFSYFGCRPSFVAR